MLLTGLHRGMRHAMPLPPSIRHAYRILGSSCLLPSPPQVGGARGSMPGAASAITSLTVAGHYIAAGTATGEVLVGSWATGAVSLLGGENGAHGGPINDLHADGFCLAVASEDSTCSVWDARTGENLATLQGHIRAVSTPNSYHFNAQFVTRSRGRHHRGEVREGEFRGGRHHCDGFS